ncbi:MAG: carbohydrate-binding family 9-like protein [Bacteroidales bacterium]
MLVPRISDQHTLTSFNSPGIQENIMKFALEENAWSDNKQIPVVQVYLAWNANFLFVNFRVEENEIRAVTSRNNEAVWEDSCVELFISPEKDSGYYNFEFSCIGTCLLAYGTGRENREYAPDELIEKIARFSSLGNYPFPKRPFSGLWELTLAIPPQAFFKHSFPAFTPSAWKANFYKCGDKLSSPHFLSWKKILAPAPDFHRPEFFGSIRLAD